MTDLARLDVSVNSSGVRASRQELSAFTREGVATERGIKTATGRMESSFSRLRTSVVSVQGAMVALGGGLALRTTVRTIADFSQAMSTVEAVSQATGSQFERLNAQAKQLGSTTRFSATQAAEGMLYLSRAGFNAEQTLSSIGATLNLAQAGALDLGSAADIASNVLQGFRLSATDAARAVDVLAFAANNSNTNVQQLGDAMKFVAPVASGLGVELETATAAVGALSDAGLQATMAGTGLRRVLSGLENPTKKAEKILNSFGVTIDEVRISEVGLVDAMSRLADAGVDTGAALEILGDRGGPAFEVLASSIPKIRQMEEELRKADGTAERIAETMDDNLNGALLATKSAAEAVVLQFGELGAESALTQSFESMAAVLRATADNMDTVVTVSGLLATVVGGRLVASNATVATRGLNGALALLGGPVGAAVVAAGAIFMFRKEISGLNEEMFDLGNSVDQITDRIEKLNKEIDEIRKQENGGALRFEFDQDDDQIRIGVKLISQQERLLELAEKRRVEEAKILAIQSGGRSIDQAIDNLQKLGVVDRGVLVPLQSAQNREANANRSFSAADLLVNGGGGSDGSGGFQGTVTPSEEANRRIQQLKQEIALFGDLTNAEAARIAISEGYYGDVTPAQEKELIRLAKLLDQKEENATAAEKQAKAEKERIKTAEELQRSLETEEERIERIYKTQRARINDVIDDDTRKKELLARNERRYLEEIEELRRRSAGEITKLFDNAAENIQRSFGDMFTDVFRNGVDGFSDFASRIKDIFARLAGEITALFVTRGIGNLILGATGGTGFLGSMGRTLGGTQEAVSSGIMGNIAQGLGLSDGAGGWMSQIGAKLGFAGDVQSVQRATQGTATGLTPRFSGTLGSLVGGGMIGAGLGGFLGGNQRSQLLGGAGGAVGMMVGGPFGAFIGGLGGSLLGGDSNHGPGLVEIFDKIDETRDSIKAMNKRVPEILGTIDEQIVQFLTDAQMDAMSEALAGEKLPKLRKDTDYIREVMHGKVSPQADMARMFADRFITIIEAIDREVPLELQEAAQGIGSLATPDRVIERSMQIIRQGLTDRINGIVGEIDEIASEMMSQANQLLGFRSAFESAGAGIADQLFRMSGTSASPLSPTERLANARSQFEDLLAQAQGGDLQAIGQVSGSAQNFLDIARQNFASSPEFFERFNFVQESLTGVQDVITEQQDRIDTHLESLNVNVERNGQMTVNRLDMILEATREQNDRIDELNGKLERLAAAG